MIPSDHDNFRAGHNKSDYDSAIGRPRSDAVDLVCALAIPPDLRHPLRRRQRHR